MNVGNTQLFQVVNAYLVACGIDNTLFHKGKKSALVAEISAFVDGKVTDVHLINNSVGVMLQRLGVIVVPACGIGLLQVDYHSHSTVHACGAGIYVNGFLSDVIVTYLIGVINAVKIAVSGLYPNALSVLLHRKTAVWLFVSAGPVQQHRSIICQRRPHLEYGIILSIICPQIAARVTVFFINIGKHCS